MTVKYSLIDDEKQFAAALDHAYINIVEHTAGNKPTSVLHDTNIELSSTNTKRTLVL